MSQEKGRFLNLAPVMELSEEDMKNFFLLCTHVYSGNLVGPYVECVKVLRALYQEEWSKTIVESNIINSLRRLSDKGLVHFNNHYDSLYVNPGVYFVGDEETRELSRELRPAWNKSLAWVNLIRSSFNLEPDNGY